jgi:hypothetical protein
MMAGAAGEGGDAILCKPCCSVRRTVSTSRELLLARKNGHRRLPRQALEAPDAVRSPLAELLSSGSTDVLHISTDDYLPLLIFSDFLFLQPYFLAVTTIVSAFML